MTYKQFGWNHPLLLTHIWSSTSFIKLWLWLLWAKVPNVTAETWTRKDRIPLWPNHNLHPEVGSAVGMNASCFQHASRWEKGCRVRTVSWTRAVSDWLQLDQPQSGAGRVNVRSIPGQQRAWIQFSVAKCAIKDENSDSLYAFLNLFSRVHINSNSHNPSKTQRLFPTIALNQLLNQPALWSMRHRSESVLVVFHGQRTTDLIFLQLISAAWRRIPSLSVPQQNRIKMAPQSRHRERCAVFWLQVFPHAYLSPSSDPEQHSDQKKNLFPLYGDLCADPLAAYKICEILVLLRNCQHVI